MAPPLYTYVQSSSIGGAKSGSAMQYHPLSASKPGQPQRIKISIPEDRLSDLKERLRLTRWPDQLDFDQQQDAKERKVDSWEYGAENSYVKAMAEYWLDGYEWQTWEDKMNEHKHFIAPDVNGIDTMHFIHEQADRDDAIPLLFIHGWPGCFFESYKIIEGLTHPTDSSQQAFHVVAPSLPGYAFSSAPRRPGFGLKEMARTLDDLMQRLGYPHYVVQGGDWGSIIARVHAAMFPDRILGIHVNMLPGLPPSPLRHPFVTGRLIASRVLPAGWVYGAEDESAIENLQQFMLKEAGYHAIQATKPQTLAFGLNDSPVGLLAWITEKFKTWSDSQYLDAGSHVKGALPLSATPDIHRDEVLTVVSLYWLTNSIASSVRIYYESLHTGDIRWILSTPISPQIPCGVAVFPKEIYRLPRDWAKTLLPNLPHWQVYDNGGHFAALEHPTILVKDIRQFVSMAKDVKERWIKAQAQKVQGRQGKL